MSDNKTTALKAFPTPIWAFQLNNFKELNEELFFHIYDLKKQDQNAPKVGTSLIWNSGFISIQKEECKKFIEAVAPTVQKVLSEMGLNLESQNGNISKLRATILPTHSILQKDSVANSYLSAIYFVKTTEESAGLSFHDPRSANTTYTPALSQFNNLNAQQITIPAEEGKIFIFPSYMQHSLGTNMSDKDQVILRFNIKVGPKA